MWVLQPVRGGLLEPGATMVRVAVGPCSRWIQGSRTTAKLGTTGFAARATLVARRLDRQHQFGVIHIHGDLIEVLFVGCWGRLRGTPVILTLHGGLNQRRLYRWLASRIFRLVDGFIVVSPTIRDTLLSFGVSSDRIAVIPSGVDTTRFCPPHIRDRTAARTSLGLQNGDLLVVSVGRLYALKGYAELIKAATGFDSASPPRFVVLGDGPDRDALRHQARSLPHVHFAGPVDHDGIVRHLHAADVFVLPSVDTPGMREGLPTAMIEAMACGLPVVCTDSGGMRDVIQHGQTGLVVPQGDVARLHAALRKLLMSPELRKSFGERNAAWARERDWRAVAGQVTAFYDYVRGMREAVKVNRWQHGRSLR